MALLEALTIDLGGAIVKGVVKVWLRDSIALEPATSTIDVLKSHIKDFQTRRHVEKQLSDLQDDLAQRLSGVIAAEFASLQEADREAAVHAASQVLENIDIPATLAKADLDSIKFEALAISAVGNSFDHLGQEPEALARLVLRETSAVIVTVAGKLPDIHISTAREALARLTSLKEDVAHLLNLLQAARVSEQNTGDRDSASFETHYRRAIATQLDRIQLFGLRMLGAGANEYGLSVAYVRMSSTVAGSALHGDVDHCLAPIKRGLIRGEAGSGKTTLLQWIAVRAALKDFPEALSHWNDRTPVYIRLRDYASKDLPTPDRFVESVAVNLLGLMPGGWMHRVLLAGALVLIDGLDELPAGRRRGFVTWLSGLLSQFPESFFLVSSRPAALDARVQLLAPDPEALDEPSPSSSTPRSRRATGFEPVQETSIAEEMLRRQFAPVVLEPMSLSDSERLISLWHVAVSRELPTDQDRARLQRYERDLLLTLQDRPALRALIANPLLCAMVCALNWDRKQRLPDDRMELYRIALELLLDGRDADRLIATHSNLGRFEKQEILDDLAYWMLLNSYSEASTDQVLNRIDRCLPRHPNLKLSSTEVLQQLLERSGVLRQPQHGVVDFIHKTFQEYMGARAAVDGGDLGILIDHAKREDWRETIVFAAGHTKGVVRRRLIEGLLKAKWFSSRAREENVTVACCLETVGSLEPDLMEELKKTAKSLFPPRNFEDARLLAPAAALEPGWLLGHELQGLPTAAACIRTATYVATRPMLDVIVELARAGGDLIEREVLRAWSTFDFELFYETVIRHNSILFAGRFDAISADYLHLLQLLVMRLGVKADREKLFAGLDSVRLRGELSLSQRASSLMESGTSAGGYGPPLTLAEATLLSRIHDIRRLVLDKVEPGAISRLSQLPALAAVEFETADVGDIADCSGISQLEHLVILGDVGDFRVVEGHRRLKRLDVSRTALRDAKMLPQMGLDYLAIPSIRGLASWSAKNHVDTLLLLYLPVMLPDLREMARLNTLQGLTLVCDHAQSAAIELPLPARLRDLAVVGAGLVDFRASKPMEELKTVRLTRVRAVKGIARLLASPALERIHLEGCGDLDLERTIGLELSGRAVEVIHN